MRHQSGMGSPGSYKAAMSDRSEERVPADLREVEVRLREERTEVSVLELDGIKRRAMAQASRRSSATRQKGLLMRRPTLLTILLLSGVLLTGSGAALALTGQFSGPPSDGPTASAAKHKYSQVCDEMRRGHRDEERTQLQRHRDERAALRRQHRAQERGLRGRQRQRVKRQNRIQRQNLKRSQKRDRQALRRANRRAERECRA